MGLSALRSRVAQTQYRERKARNVGRAGATDQRFRRRGGGHHRQRRSATRAAARRHLERQLCGGHRQAGGSRKADSISRGQWLCPRRHGTRAGRFRAARRHRRFVAARQRAAAAARFFRRSAGCHPPVRCGNPIVERRGQGDRDSSRQRSADGPSLYQSLPFGLCRSLRAGE